MKIYLGGAMFTKADILNNLHLTQKLRDCGFDVYCPNENMSINDKSHIGITPEMIYEEDIKELETCNIFLCQLSDDPGTMWEAGYMDCLSKKIPDKGYIGCIGLTTDIRWNTLPNGELSGVNNQAFYFNGFVIGGLNLSLGVYYDEYSLFAKLKQIQNVWEIK